MSEFETKPADNEDEDSDDDLPELEDVADGAAASGVAGGGDADGDDEHLEEGTRAQTKL